MKLIRKHNELNLLKESDGFEWIRDVDIVNHIEMPYFKSMEEYGLKPDEYEITLSKVFSQPVTIDDGSVYNKHGNIIYYETSYGYWGKSEYDNQGNKIYYENSDGYWWKYEYDERGNKIYFEDSDGYWKRYEYDANGNKIYFEDSDGEIKDYRNLNESDDFDWIRDMEELPIPGTAWVMEINPEDSEEAQHKLFDTGFEWSFGGKQIQRTPGIVAFASYGGWDISDKNFKWVPNGSYNLDYIINHVQPNDLLIYEYKNGVSKLKNTNLNESDDFDWIRDVGSNISFYDVRVNEKYNVELTDEFYKALNQCFGPLEPYELMGYKRTTNVRVIGKDMMKHTDVYCYSENNNKVISLHLEFYNDNGTNIADHFWVTEEMANLFPRVTDLNESDDLDWIRDVDITNHMEPPYFKNMKEYGISPNEYDSILSKVFNQPVKCRVTVQGYFIHDKQGKKNFYFEDSKGYWIKHEYDEKGNEIYTETSSGYIEDNRHLNESDEMDWIKDVDITNHIEPPYFKSMEEYGLSEKEYPLALSKVFNEPVTIKGDYVYNNRGNNIYYEDSYGFWRKWEYDGQGNEIYHENSFDFWRKSEYDGQGNLIYFEDNDGTVIDNRHLNESEEDDLDWIRDVKPHDYILTDDEWVRLNNEVSELMKDPHIRVGQAYMIALGRVNERIYNHVTGTNLDPWGGGVSYMKLLGFLRGEYYGIK